MAAFDPVDISDNIREGLNLEDDEEAFSLNYEAIGIESSYSNVNLGTLNIIIVIHPLFFILIKLLPMCTRKHPKSHTYFTNLRERTFLNGVLAFFEGIF